MLEKIKNIEPEQSVGIILLAIILSFTFMDLRFVIPAGLIVIATLIISLYKIFTDWRWALKFLGYIVYVVVGIIFIILFGMTLLLIVPLALLFFIAFLTSRKDRF
ncbi:TPA: hypothetical protein ACONLI_002776 [Staphylococcus aureus]|uniref:hypothetical protein n=1 Tax=Staphylococcus TaxID=1279 RepID=UPI000E3E42C3|nr:MULTISPECIES: hypothetical protein [Staphylococcus]GBX15331.1 hypothetical protein M6C025_2467 [Staphylococcus aureus]GBZ22504.1 hypothetical protein M6K122_2566 [Staphylococcus aureus]HCV0918787.1 hypothetical protein [Staphylococcus aureus]HDB6039404.1 hypothetical protein [Staphylococcus aureus]HDB6084047.1 hypothetical protein [Staphylococcus aureus]